MVGGLQEKMSVNPKTGEVHIPSPHRSGPGHPKGTFLYKDNELKERPGKHMKMNPGRENVWIQFTLPRSLIGIKPKKYRLSMRFQTNQEQEAPLQLEVKNGNQDVVHSMDIPIPNTKNEWQTMKPIDIDVKLGGSNDTLLVFTHPKPIGKGILIRDFSLLMDNPYGSGEYSIEWLANLLETLQEKLKEDVIPQLDDAQVPTFRETCDVAFAAYKKVKQTNEDGAKRVAEKEFAQTMEACQEAALPLYEGSIDSALESIDPRGTELLQAIVLAHGKPSELAVYAAEGPLQKKRLKNLLQGDNDLMYQMLVNGGPREGAYGAALDIYAEIESKRQQGKSVLPKLSLAVALEFSQPRQAFQSTVFIDPLERYLYYEQAYLAGELDPAFEHLSVWELRMAVNSNAPNEQLTWCRDMLRAYNPNIATLKDYASRYTWIVKTEVTYNEPVWRRTPHDYIQILSDGGMCGPIAWFGRFVCQAFGNPTWGVKQPAHAAVSRWTPTGWVMFKGGAFRRAWWEDPIAWWEERDGTDFECETKLRACLGNDIYFQKVALLDWIAVVEGEKQIMTKVNSTQLWPALAIVQRRRLSKMNGEPPKKQEGGQCEVLTLCESYMQRTKQKECVTNGDDGSIFVPVSSRTKAEGQTNFMNSFVDDGMQCFVKPGFSLTFKLPANMVPEEKAYRMSLRFVTVHETDTPPFNVSVANGSDEQEHELSFRMNWKNLGKMQSTNPTEVRIGGSETILKLTRKGGQKKCTVKELRLTPC